MFIAHHLLILFKQKEKQLSFHMPIKKTSPAARWSFDLSKPETRLLSLSTTPWSWQVMGSDQVLGRLVPVNS
ncbi:hypothetical protein, partial [uncultured Dubosiella sp.]|uniref:hypothetical protein n=1 Tax=uncultured Dubosiella sp. TaxID=1937011 RepID=UPI00272A682E